MRAFISASFLMAAGACTAPCNADTCATGCCQGNLCYEGLGRWDGAPCDIVPGAGGNGGGFTGSGGGTSGSGGGACVEDGDPCNDQLRCCDQHFDMFNLVCKNEHCDLCNNPGYECTGASSIECCPGYDCLLKPGFTTVYECQ